MGKIISLISVFLWLALCGFCTEHYIKKRLPCYDPLSFPFHPKKYRREPVCFSPNINGCASPVLWYAAWASESNQNSVQNVCCAVAPRITVMSLGQGSASARSSFCWAGTGFISAWAFRAGWAPAAGSWKTIQSWGQPVAAFPGASWGSGPGLLCAEVRVSFFWRFLWQPKNTAT